MVNFSKTAGGSVEIDFNGEGSNFIGNPHNVIISGKPNEVYSVNPTVKGPKIHISWDGGFFDYRLEEITVGGVAPVDLESAKASLADIFNGNV